MARKKKRKKVTTRLVKEKYAGQPTEPYRIMAEVMAARRDDLKKAGVKIGIAWNSSWREDADGHLQLGKCAKRKDLDRELSAYDFIVSLNEDVWSHLTDTDKYRLIWHELLHAEVKYDSDGSVLKDDKDRVVCRIRKHDIQEFREIITEYGMEYDLNAEAKKAHNDAQRPLFAKAAEKPTQGKPTAKQQKRKKRKVKSIQETVAETE